MKYCVIVLWCFVFVFLCNGLIGQNNKKGMVDKLPDISLGAPKENYIPDLKKEIDMLTDPNRALYNLNRNNQNGMDQYELDKAESKKRNRDQYDRAFGNETDCMLNYTLPDYSSLRKSYLYASGELLKMLEGTRPLNIKEAVFITENAFYDNVLVINRFNEEINNLVNIAMQKAKQEGYNWADADTRKVMLFRVLSDTLVVKTKSQEKSITSFPMQYDFEDYKGEQDWSKMFVTKLLMRKSGQCHSLPLLYLILCEAAGTNAHLAFAPSHTYALFFDKKGNKYNLELTNGHVVSDAFILGSGYINAQALKNRIYMEPLSNKKLIAHMVSDLAMGYVKRFGYDAFVLKCAETTLKYDSSNLTALMLKANVRTCHMNYALQLADWPKPESVVKYYPKIYKLWQMRDSAYSAIDNSGFQEMPAKVYEEWLKEVKREQENQKMKNEMYMRINTVKK